MNKYVWTISSKKHGNASGNTPEEALIKFRGMFPDAKSNTTITCEKCERVLTDFITPADPSDYTPHERLFRFFGKLHDLEDKLNWKKLSKQIDDV